MYLQLGQLLDKLSGEKVCTRGAQLAQLYECGTLNSTKARKHISIKDVQNDNQERQELSSG